jgi:hypothetical protein
MVDRRSLGEALALSPEKMAFIQGGDVTGGAVPSKAVAKNTTRTIELPSSTKSDVAALTPEAVPTRERQRRPRASETARPESDELLDKMLVPVTTRLPNGLVQSLRRLCLEQKIHHAKPDSIQEVVHAALEEWLLKRTR